MDSHNTKLCGILFWFDLDFDDWELVYFIF